MEDLLEQANEIQETLGRSYAVPDEIDEADLQAGTRLVYASALSILLTASQSWMPLNWMPRRRVHPT